jgi:hypothetical protein
MAIVSDDHVRDLMAACACAPLSLEELESSPSSKGKEDLLSYCGNRKERAGIFYAFTSPLTDILS